MSHATSFNKSYTIKDALVEYKTIKTNNDFADDTTRSRALSHARTAQDLLDQASPEEIREYLDITRSILNDLEKRMNEVEQALEEKAPDVATKQEEPAPTPKAKGAARVKKSKKVDAQVEATKGRKIKRDVNPDDAQRIDEAKQVAQSVKPLKVEQEKRSTTKKAPAEKAKKQPACKHEGMTYAEVRKQVSERKAKLNKADQERMSKAGLRNNTWEGAIASLEWLNKYFPAK